MNTTALSIAGAFTMTAAAAVTAMFLTVGAGAESSDAAPAAAPIRYEVIEVPLDAAAVPLATEYDDDHEDDHEYEDDDHEDDHEYEDDDHEDDHDD